MVCFASEISNFADHRPRDTHHVESHMIIENPIQTIVHFFRHVCGRAVPTLAVIGRLTGSAQRSNAKQESDCSIENSVLQAAMVGSSQ